MAAPAVVAKRSMIAAERTAAIRVATPWRARTEWDFMLAVPFVGRFSQGPGRVACPSTVYLAPIVPNRPTAGLRHSLGGPHHAIALLRTRMEGALSSPHLTKGPRVLQRRSVGVLERIGHHQLSS